MRGKLVLIYDGGIYDSRSKGYWLNFISDISEELTWEASTPNAKWFVHSNWQASNSTMKIDHLGNYLDDLVRLSYDEKIVMPNMGLNAASIGGTPGDFSIPVNAYVCGKISQIDPTKRLGLVYMDFYATLVVPHVSYYVVTYDYILDDRRNALPYVVIARNYYKHNLIPTP